MKIFFDCKHHSSLKEEELCDNCTKVYLYNSSCGYTICNKCCNCIHYKIKETSLELYILLQSKIPYLNTIQCMWEPNFKAYLKLKEQLSGVSK